MLFLLFEGEIAGFKILPGLGFHWKGLLKQFVEVPYLIFVLLLSDITTLFCVLDCVHS